MSWQNSDCDKKTSKIISAVETYNHTHTPAHLEEDALVVAALSDRRCLKRNKKGPVQFRNGAHMHIFINQVDFGICDQSQTWSGGRCLEDPVMLHLTSVVIHIGLRKTQRTQEGEAGEDKERPHHKYLVKLWSFSIIVPLS
jgi:hypothetical protein